MTQPPIPLTLAGLPHRRLDSLAGLRAALIGIAEASPYVPGDPSHAAGAPHAIRTASKLFAAQLNQFDFDLGRTLLPKDAGELYADLGDLPTHSADPAGNRARITAAIRQMLAAGVAPVVLGGDDSVPIPVFRAFEGRGPFTIVQVDAHVDWGDEIRGNPFGYGSTMRRASELPWISGMVQIGIRGLGSGTEDQHAVARGWGSQIVTAQDVRRRGMDAVLALIPDGTECLLTIDCDGLDPSVLPAVNMPTPGGLDYRDMQALFEGLARRGRVRGCNLVEYAPARDRDGMSGVVAARMALTALGLVS